MEVKEVNSCFIGGTSCGSAKISDSTMKDGDINLNLKSKGLTELSITQLPVTNNHFSITVLNISFNQIISLPQDFVTLLPNLQRFIASGNQMKNLPHDIGVLTSLREVNLCENELTSLPDSVQYLVNLESLQLRGNKLSSLPEDFGEMGNLKMLVVDENQLTKFPPTFALLSKLQTLDAGFNKLHILPKHLGSMHSLTVLNLSNNQLKALPDSFSQLKELVCVDISENHLMTLPAEFSSQTTLKKLYAGSNYLTDLPQWIGQIPHLTELCLKENDITGDCLPKDFGQMCKKLHQLNLCGNHLTKLPESFGELESLQFLHLGSMLEELERGDHINGNWLCDLPVSFPQLTMLTTLRLDENHLRVLPSDFGRLCNLEYLDLGQNLLYDLPESFGGLGKLRVCLLSRNNIQLLPSSFGQLTGLEKLIMDFNQLAELPESFGELQQLHVLDLYHNKLTELPSCLDKLTNLNFLDLLHNPLKVPKKLVPSIRPPFTYKQRVRDPKSKWRGRMRLGTEHFNDMKVIVTEGEDDGDEMADEPIDEVYGSEDLPYNFRFKRSPDISVVSKGKSQSTETFRRLWHHGELREVSNTDHEEEADSSSSVDRSQCEEHFSYDSQDEEEEETEEAWDNAAQTVDESWETANCYSAHSAEEEEDWEKDLLAQSQSQNEVVRDDGSEVWDDPVQVGKETQIDPSIEAYLPLLQDEDWEKDLATTPSSHNHSVRPTGYLFTSNVQAKFFLVPDDLHAPATFRPRLHDPQYVPPTAEEGQFDDKEEYS